MSAAGSVVRTGSPQVRVTTSSGSITVTAETRDDVEVTSNGKVAQRPASQQDPIDVPRSAEVKVRCPVGTDVMAGTSSGSVRLLGDFGDVRITSQSGSMSVGNASSTDLRTASGDVEVEHCDGTCRVTTTSGSVRVRSAGEADVRGGSGDVRVSGVTAQVRTVSGSIDLAAGGDVTVATVSGSITVSMDPSVHPRVVTRGRKAPKIDVAEGNECDVSVCSLSDSVTVRSR